jgi:hypothetical protein
MKVIASISSVLLIGMALACDGKPPESVAKKIEQSSAAAAVSEVTGNELMNPTWSADSLWQKGYEEITEYRVEQGNERFVETRRTYKDLFNKQLYTSTADTTRRDLFAVIVQHRTAMATPNESTMPSVEKMYTSSVAVTERDMLNTAKFSMAYTAAGNTVTKTLRRMIGHTVMYYHAWQGEFGDGDHELGKNYLLYDQLPLSLRGLNFKAGQEFIWQVLEEQTTPSAAKPGIVAVEFKIERIDTVTIATAKIPCWKVSAEETSGKTTAFWFDVKSPNTFVQMKTEDSRAELVSRKYIQRKPIQ